MRLVLSLAAVFCVLWTPPSAFTPAGAATAQASSAEHDHATADDHAHDRHTGHHHHDGTVADHSHDGGSIVALPAGHLYAVSSGWYGSRSVLGHPDWSNTLERPPRAAAAS